MHAWADSKKWSSFLTTCNYFHERERGVVKTETGFSGKNATSLVPIGSVIVAGPIL